jgi:hypothetical protein
MRDTDFLGFKPGTGSVPPFWVQENDRAGNAIHPAVREESYKLWPWAYRYVGFVLHDPPRAAELLNGVARAVSKRLQVEPDVGRNLKGYLIAAFRHRVGRELIRDGRITYEGLLRELERKQRFAPPNRLVTAEVRIYVGQIVALMRKDAQRIAHYRLLDFTWKDIAKATGIPASQARNQYYYGIKTAWEKLNQSAGKR